MGTPVVGDEGEEIGIDINADFLDAGESAFSDLCDANRNIHCQIPICSGRWAKSSQNSG